MNAPTILMVDDHAAFRLRARALLEAQGFVILGEAGDGRTGLLQAERLRPDIALVDIGLPDLDGFAVAAAIRSAGAARLVVLISGRDSSDFGGRIERSMADAFIPKADLSGERLAHLLGSAG